MSRGFSRVVLVGNIGRDPEMRYSQNGTPVTTFTVAVNRRRRGQDGNFADETDWYRVTLFRQQAERAAEWLHRGSKVLVDGQLQIRTYTGNDGQERTSVEVIADNFQNLTPREEDGGSFRGGANAGGGAGGNARTQNTGAAPLPRPAQPAAARSDDDFDDFDDVPF